ncbi:VanZ family protein [Rubellicoccus peritrichatus]|uniref:VanZ family protein n=1 Tax=Rubellicoccus peritrichatus TaxID=3080537 RepID=A0AAQ3QS07_9BACT|nr:VanZ family protein [Puniceicoccus sp. CR14]WOO41873.1 VanZ family protein [Puniceicoccus sp. CR14]
MSKKWKRIRGWSWPVLIAICITLVSGTNNLVVPNLGLFSSDKLKHLLVFGLLSTAIIRNFSLEQKGITTILIAGVATSLFGMGDEIWQSFTPGRTLDIWDWLADTIGAFTAAIAYRHFHAYRRILEKDIFPKKNVES